jgi:hypothetical protein
MNSITKIISLVALAITVLPSVLYFLGFVGAEPMKWTALVGTIAWFIATPMWMGCEPQIDDTEVEI